MGLAAKLDGYRRRAGYEWKQLRQRTAARKREAAFQSWLDALSAKPPEVLVGANFAAYGGVRHHIQAIQRYSSLNVDFAPPEYVLKTVGPHHLSHDFRQRFLDFPAKGIKVVHSHVFPWFIEWCREKQNQGIRWVHTYHLNYFPEHGRNGIEPWQEQINCTLVNVACQADIALSVSRWQRDYLLREHGIETSYLPNGVDIAACDRADSSRFVRKTGLIDFMLWVGRNDPVKDPIELVRLADRMPDQQFVMIGGGFAEGDPLGDWPETLPDNLSLLGSMSHSDVQDAIAASLAVIVTSKREGLPTLVMEGMAHGKPVIVPDEPGCTEVLGSGDTGLVYKLGDLDDLTEKACQARVDRSYGVEARKRVVSEYDWKKIAPRLDDLYLH
ncbi:glycosyltransferase family 4 protein [Elongatibacter sediminis]|uniref:Glycosyltransferase family 4 protein n=1 Tax=Elongatibacter sediminis TaxID=3119006 RepID=A0AAW9RGT3_9GAMM